MQKDKLAAMNIWRGGIAEMKTKKRPYDFHNAESSGMDSHGQQRANQRAKHSAIIRTRGNNSPGVDKARFAYMDERTLWAKILYPKHFCFHAQMHK